VNKLKKNIIIISIVGIIITSIILIIGPDTFVSNFSKLRIEYLVPFFSLYGLSYAIRSYAWKEVFNIINQKVKYRNLFYSTGISILLNELIPFKIGDLARLETVTKKEGLPYGVTLSCLAIYRILDLLVIVTLALVGILMLFFFGTAQNLFINQILLTSISFGLIVVLFISLLIVFKKEEQILSIINKISSKIANWMYKLIHPFNISLKEIIKNRRQLVKPIFVDSIAILLDSLLMILLLPAFNIVIDPLIIMIASLFIFLSSIIPILPGGWGISEVIGTSIIVVFYPSIEISTLLSLVLIDHFLRFLYAIVYGGISIVKMDYSWKNRINTDNTFE
jgi:uncharacterized protein (TIRG00374 family)